MGFPRLRYPSGATSQTIINFKRGPIDFLCQAAGRVHDSLAASGFRARNKEAVDLLITFTMPAVYIGDDYPAWAAFAAWASQGGTFDFVPNARFANEFHCVSDDVSFQPSRKGLGWYEMQLAWRVVPDSVRPASSGQVMQWYYGLPLVALLIDVSGSIANSGSLADEKSAAASFCLALSPSWQVGAWKFSYVIVQIQPYTTDRNSVLTAIGAISGPIGGTQLYDVLTLVAAGAPAHIVLITDGFDDGSTHTEDQAIAACIAGGSAVHALGFGAASATVLGQIAAQTGGSCVIRPEASDLIALAASIGIGYPTPR